MRISKRFFIFGSRFVGSTLFSVMLTSVMLTSIASTHATPLAVGLGVGVDFPFAHAESSDPGIALEGIFRADPFEVRFHFAEIESKVYAVSLGYKFFFNDDMLRVYAEPAVGPMIVDTPGAGKSAAFGIRPEASLGVDIGINTNLSVGVVSRYFTMFYFGDTASGKFEANHGLSLLANLIYWF
jgi:hypothetical protein